MLKTEETTATEVFLHAADHGDRPVIHGAEVDYDDIHAGVRYHADLLAAAEKECKVALEAATKASRDLDDAARCVAITVDLADKDDRDPRSWSTYNDDLAAYRTVRDASRAAHDALQDAALRRDTLRAKRDQDAALKTYEVPA